MPPYAVLHDADPRGELGRRVDVYARAEGLHRVHERAPVGAAATKELVAPLEPLRLLQPRQREVRQHVLIACQFGGISCFRLLRLADATVEQGRFAVQEAKGITTSGGRLVRSFS